MDVQSPSGERVLSEARRTREVRDALLLRWRLSATDHRGIRQRIEGLLGLATVLRNELRTNPRDERKRRQCLVTVAEAVYLASDDDGVHAEWLMDKCRTSRGGRG